VRYLTLQELNDQYGGILPPDAVLRPSDYEQPRPATGNKESVPPAADGEPTRRSRKGERFETLNGFTDCSLADLSGSETKVWLILFRDTKSRTGIARTGQTDLARRRTGQTDLARRAGLSRRGVQVAIKKLKEKGLVQVTRRGQLNQGPSAYRVRPTGIP
jgi:hypothetical protein